MSEHNIYNDDVLMYMFCCQIVTGFLKHCEEKGTPINDEIFSRFIDVITSELEFSYED